MDKMLLNIAIKYYGGSFLRECTNSAYFVKLEYNCGDTSCTECILFDEAHKEYLKQQIIDEQNSKK